MRRIKVLTIDSEKRVISEAYVSTLADMQKIVGGLIERAYIYPNGDEVYVNEEGLFGEVRHIFKIWGAHQPFAGNAFVIGGPDSRGEMTDVRSKPSDISVTVLFFDLKEKDQ